MLQLAGPRLWMSSQSAGSQLLGRVLVLARLTLPWQWRQCPVPGRCWDPRWQSSCLDGEPASRREGRAHFAPSRSERHCCARGNRGGRRGERCLGDADGPDEECTDGRAPGDDSIQSNSFGLAHSGHRIPLEVQHSSCAVNTFAHSSCHFHSKPAPEGKRAWPRPWEQRDERRPEWGLVFALHPVPTEQKGRTSLH